MCIGDCWEVYIPAEMGYGKYSQRLDAVTVAA